MAKAPTSFHLDAALLKRLRVACAEREISQSDAVASAIEYWLSASPSANPGAVLAQDGQEQPKGMDRKHLPSVSGVTSSQKLLGVESSDSASRDPVSAESLRDLLLEVKADILAELAAIGGAKPPRPRKAGKAPRKKAG